MTILLVDNHLLQLPLCCRSLDNLVIDGVGGDKSVDHHRSGLSNSVTSVLSLVMTMSIMSIMTIIIIIMTRLKTDVTELDKPDL